MKNKKYNTVVGTVPKSNKQKRRKRKNRYPNFPLPALCPIFLHGWSTRDSYSLLPWTPALNLGLTWKRAEILL